MSTIKETVWDGTRFLEIDAGTVDGKDAVEFEISDPEIQIHIKKAHAPSNAQKNSDITKAEIEAKLTGEINTHFHAPLDNTLEEAKIHMADSSIHVLSTDKTRWEDKYTKAEINTKFNVVEANNYWKPPVNTFASISTTYPTPADGWVVSVKDTKYTYRYDGAKWIPISANAIQNATSSVSGLMSNIDKSKLDNIEAEANKYIHPATHPPSIIAQDTNNRFMTDAERAKLSGISAGANAYVHPATHPASVIVQDTLNRFMTDAERTKLSEIEAGANKYTHPATHPPSIIAQDASNRFMTDAERTKLSGIATGATLVANSATNGNITINGAQQIVYTHPAGTNPHATTKADIGLSLVDNIQQATKAEFNTHNADAVKHITAAERTVWNSQLPLSGGTVTGNVIYNENITVRKDIMLGNNASASIRYNETTQSLDFIGNSKVFGDLLVTGEILNKASTTSEGVVRLNNSFNSTSLTEAPTANALNSAYLSLLSEMNSTGKKTTVNIWT